MMVFVRYSSRRIQLPASALITNSVVIILNDEMVLFVINSQLLSTKGLLQGVLNTGRHTYVGCNQAGSSYTPGHLNMLSPERGLHRLEISKENVQPGSYSITINHRVKTFRQIK